MAMSALSGLEQRRAAAVLVLRPLAAGLRAPGTGENERVSERKVERETQDSYRSDGCFGHSGRGGGGSTRGAGPSTISRGGVGGCDVNSNGRVVVCHVPGDASHADAVAAAANLHAATDADLFADADATAQPLPHALSHSDGLPTAAYLWPSISGNDHCYPDTNRAIFSITHTNDDQ